MPGVKALIVVALLSAGAFWFVDLPQTIRLKATIIRMLPLAPTTKIATIDELCKGARPADAAFCYLAFRSEDAEASVSCERFGKQVSRSENWVKVDDDNYLYRGKDPEFADLGLIYHPSSCAVVSVAKQVSISMKEYPSVRLPY